MRKTNKNVWMRAVFALAVGISGLSAQTNTAILTGRVLDSSGSTVAQANLMLTQSETAYSRKATTDEAGNFQFPLLPPGSYEVVVAHSGFKTEKREGIVLAAGRPGPDRRDVSCWRHNGNGLRGSQRFANEYRIQCVRLCCRQHAGRKPAAGEPELRPIDYAWDRSHQEPPKIRCPHFR
jgi:Carboxypeptidase regulatory-like domain